MSVGLVKQPMRRPPHRGRGLVLGVAWLSIMSCGGDSLLPPVDAPIVDLSITMTSNMPAPPEGRTVAFTLRVANAGPLEATGVLAGDTLPSGLTYVSHSATTGAYQPETGIWTIGALPRDTVAILTLVARPETGTSGSTFTNMAGVLSTDLNDSIPDNNVAQVSVTVGPPLPPGTFEFSSDWSTALGASDAAVLDGWKWTNVGGDNSHGIVLEVIPPAAVNGEVWPGPGNVLAINEHPSDYVIASVGDLPPSTRHWGRLYLMFEAGMTPQRNMHPFCYDLVGNIDIVYLTFGARGANPTVTVVHDSDFGIGTEGGAPQGLTAGVWYRYEWEIEYVTPTEVRIWPRIYDMAGTLLYAADNSGTLGTFIWENDANTTLAEYQLANTLTVNPEDAREVGLGNPSSLAESGRSIYVANYALSTLDWIGAQ